jgi:hypothetical protein
MSTGILLTVVCRVLLFWLSVEKMLAWCCARAGSEKKSGRAHMLAQFLSGKKTKSVANYGRRGDPVSARQHCFGEAAVFRRGGRVSARQHCFGEAALFRRGDPVPAKRKSRGDRGDRGKNTLQNIFD